MRRRWTALLLSALLPGILAGCSRNEPAPVRQSHLAAESAAAATPATSPETKAPTGPLIVAFGDSLSAGYGAPTGDSYPDYLQQILRQKHYPYQVINLGVSGNTTTDGLERLDSVLALKPRIVILELGGNDGLRGVPVADTRANLEKMIIELQKAGIKVVLAGMTLPPNYGPDYIRAFQAVYQDLAHRYHLTLIPFLLQGIVAKAQSQPGLIQADGIHPTAAGNRIVAGTVFQYLKPLLKQRTG
jgi:acyl-CoA thioesterase-1